MSITLTNRDTATLAFSMASAQADGVTLVNTTNTTADSHVMKQRFQRTGTKKPRGNVNLVRTKYDSTSQKTGKLVLDQTLSAENPELFSVDEIDDFVTAGISFFNTEADAANLLMGIPRS